jgi:hypothetical protein
MNRARSRSPNQRSAAHSYLDKGRRFDAAGDTDFAGPEPGGIRAGA